MTKMLQCLFLMTLLLLTFGCSKTVKYPISDHYDGKNFKNPNGSGPKSLIEVMKWKYSSNPIVWPEFNEDESFQKKPEATHANGVKITFVGHSTFLIQMNGLNILTDPIWAKRASPFSFVGPKAAHQPGIKFSDLPKIDVVIVSHNHYDHMDEWTLSELQKKDSPLFIVPLANKKFLENFGARNIVELDWWEKNTFKDLEITLAPAQHWSSRTPFDRMQALWGSFFIKDQKNSFYFAGDTGYGDHFKTIKDRLGSPQISFIPIGAYEPRWFMKDSHMNPEDALLAHQDLMSESSIGMHFGMFQLTDEGIDDPALELEELKLKGKITNFVALKPGDVFSR